MKEKKRHKLLVIFPTGEEYQIGFLSPCRDGSALSAVFGISWLRLTRFPNTFSLFPQYLFSAAAEMPGPLASYQDRSLSHRFQQLQPRIDSQFDCTESRSLGRSRLDHRQDIFDLFGNKIANLERRVNKMALAHMGE